MISKSEIDMMMQAYSLMYKIENSLRLFILNNMKKNYGPNWYREAPRLHKLRPNKKEFDRLYFYELIPYINSYPCLTSDVSKKVVNSLQKLVTIRNKIAHHIGLTEREFNQLSECYILLNKYLSDF